MRSRIGIALVLVLVVLATVSTAGGASDHPGQADFASVRRATARFHDVAVAEQAGYQSFLPCLDSETEGGQGQHYVNFALFDNDYEAVAERPEALVYEVRGDKLKLVAVEYLVRNSADVAADPPVLFGQEFHYVEALDVWALHAWVWEPHPVSMFADYNPRVALCP